MTKKKWVVVEDKEERMLAYVEAFAKSEVPPDDDLHVLYFPQALGKKFADVIPGGEQISHESVSSVEELTRAVELLLAGNDPLVILLDVVLITYNNNEPIQCCENIPEYWGNIDKRTCDDLVVMISLEEATEDLLSRTGLGKVCLGDERVSSGNPVVRLRQATAIINGASREWASRYALPGKKFLHALMCAGSCGESKGHIHNFNKSVEVGFPQFPLRSAFDGDDLKENSFKALFCYATKERVMTDSYHCELGTMSRSMLACGIPCIISDKIKNCRGFLPASPGAIFFVHFCRLVSLLDDPEFNNPVINVRMFFNNHSWWMRLEFNHAVTDLHTAYKDYNEQRSGTTVKALVALQQCCLPITPEGDATIEKTFLQATQSLPKPNEEHVNYVRITMPCQVISESRPVVEYKWDMPMCLSIIPAVPEYKYYSKGGRFDDGVLF